MHDTQSMLAPTYLVALQEQWVDHECTFDAGSGKVLDEVASQTVLVVVNKIVPLLRLSPT